MNLELGEDGEENEKILFSVGRTAFVCNSVEPASFWGDILFRLVDSFLLYSGNAEETVRLAHSSGMFSGGRCCHGMCSFRKAAV